MIHEVRLSMLRRGVTDGVTGKLIFFKQIEENIQRKDRKA